MFGFTPCLALASGPGFTPQGALSFPGAFMTEVLATLLAFKVSGLGWAAPAWLSPCPTQTRDLKREESGQHLGMNPLGRSELTAWSGTDRW